MLLFSFPSPVYSVFLKPHNRIQQTDRNGLTPGSFWIFCKSLFKILPSASVCLKNAFRSRMWGRGLPRGTETRPQALHVMWTHVMSSEELETGEFLCSALPLQWRPLCNTERWRGREGGLAAAALTFSALRGDRKTLLPCIQRDTTPCKSIHWKSCRAPSCFNKLSHFLLDLLCFRLYNAVVAGHKQEKWHEDTSPWVEPGGCGVMLWDALHTDG